MWPVVAGPGRHEQTRLIGDTPVCKLRARTRSISMSNERACHDPVQIVSMHSLFFFFQAEDGIRDVAVTGVQTCALPIYAVADGRAARLRNRAAHPKSVRGTPDRRGGFALSRPAPHGDERMDPLGVESDRHQSQGQVLPADACRTERAAKSGREL